MPPRVIFRYNDAAPSRRRNPRGPRLNRLARPGVRYVVEKIEDTREYARDSDGRYRPVVGSGEHHACDNCDKDHVVHVLIREVRQFPLDALPKKIVERLSPYDREIAETQGGVWRRADATFNVGRDCAEALSGSKISPSSWNGAALHAQYAAERRDRSVEKNPRRRTAAPSRRRNPSDIERARTGDKNLAGANLEGASLATAFLAGANLSGADLRRADLEYADLKGATLADANLQWANLHKAYLEDANLAGANLRWAILADARIKGTNFKNALLEDANLRGADLRNADLRNANLRGADIKGANLEGANLEGADLVGANLEGTILEKFTATRPARSFGRQTGAVLKMGKPNAPPRAADFKKKYPAEFERLKGDTQGRDFSDTLRSKVRQKYETPFAWLVTEGRYIGSTQRLCPDSNFVYKFNIDLTDPSFTERQREALKKLAETSRRSGHPHEKHDLFTVGWVRLCVNDAVQTWLVEEVQSDVSVVRSKLKDGSAPAGLEQYADVVRDLQPYLDRFYEDALGVVFMEAEKRGYAVEMLDYPAKKQHGSPRNVYTDLPRSMGMTKQKGSKVLPEQVYVEETWFYKPNPRRRNPRAACPTKLVKYEYLGTTDEVTTCDCCGKTGLKNTVAIRDLDEGEVMYFGVTCAARALKVQVADVKKGAADADRQRREEEFRRRDAENRANTALWHEWLIERTGGIYEYDRSPDVLRMIQALGGMAAARVGFEDWKAAKKARSNPRRRTASRRTARRNPREGLIATTRTAAENRADIARHAAAWNKAAARASLLRSSLRTVEAELAHIDAAVDAEEPGAEALWAHRPTVVAHRRHLAGLLLDAERTEREALKQLHSYGVMPAALDER